MAKLIFAYLSCGVVLGGIIYKILRDKLKEEFAEIKYLEHNFVSKEDLARQYVSKEKLMDCLDPITKKLDSLQSSVDKIKDWLMSRKRNESL